MNTLVRSAHAGFADDDAQGYEYTQTSIARLAACLGADFAPYLPFVIPPLIDTGSKAVRAPRVRRSRRCSQWQRSLPLTHRSRFRQLMPPAD